MMKKITVKLALERPNKEGFCAIYVRVTIDRKKKDFPTGKKVLKRYWDAENRTIKLDRRLANARVMKRFVEDRRNEMEGKITRMELDGHPISFAALLEKDLESASIPFWKYCQQLNDLNLSRAKIGGSSYKTYQKAIYRIREFDPEIQVGRVNAEWMERFQNFMLDRGIRTCIANYFKAVKIWVKAALKKGDMIRNPFDQFEIVRFKKAEREFLSLDELNRLGILYWDEYANKTFSPHRFWPFEKRVLELFLLGCYCGLRKCDLKRLRWEHIVLPQKGKEGFIRISQQKTLTPVHIPISAPLERILLNLSRDGLLVFPHFPTPGTIQKKIKVLKGKIGVTKHLSFHCSRHTFATSCLTMGMSMEVVSKLLGHADLKTTKIYARMVNLRLENEMRMFDPGRFLQNQQKKAQNY